MPYADPVRRREHLSRWREAHPERMREVRKLARARQRQKMRAIVAAAKDCPCADCGRRFPACVMEFDHARGVKAFNIGNPGSWQSQRRLRAEIAKCDVVCANCHCIRTHARLGAPVE